jgi:hypothetical protein
VILAVTEEIPSRDISVVESRIFAALLIGEGNLVRESNRFTSCFRVLWFLHLVLIFWNPAIVYFSLVGHIFVLSRQLLLAKK